MTSIMEQNPLVASGEYGRVFVSELEPGDHLATGEVVHHVDRVTDHVTVVRLADGSARPYACAFTTVLVRIAGWPQ